MKKLVFYALILSSMFTYSCSVKQKYATANKMTELTVPFTENQYRTDKDYFRASQSGASADLATAKKIALLNARTELANNVNSLIKAVINQYSSQRNIENKKELASKFEEQTMNVINQSLNDVKIIGDKVFKTRKGVYEYFIVVEMSKKSLVQEVTKRMSSNENLKLDFDAYQFNKVFEEEMNKIEK